MDFERLGWTADASQRARDLLPLFESAARRFNVSLPVLLAVAYTESRFRTTPVSRAGAGGVMQFMPATWRGMAKRLGLDTDPSARFDPEQAVPAGAAFLAMLIRSFESKPEGAVGVPPVYAAIASYNAGPGRVRNRPEAYWPSETRKYAAAVANRAVQLRALFAGLPIPNLGKPARPRGSAPARPRGSAPASPSSPSRPTPAVATTGAGALFGLALALVLLGGGR